MQHKDAEVGALACPTKLLAGLLDVLGELSDRVLQSLSRIVDFVNDEDVLADKVRHFEAAHVQPLCSCNDGAWLLNRVASQRFVEGQTDSLNRYIWRSRPLQKRAITSQTNQST
jgi:hypothetical protein